MHRVKKNSDSSVSPLILKASCGKTPLPPHLKKTFYTGSKFSIEK